MLKYYSQIIKKSPRNHCCLTTKQFILNYTSFTDFAKHEFNIFLQILPIWHNKSRLKDEGFQFSLLFLTPLVENLLNHYSILSLPESH